MTGAEFGEVLVPKVESWFPEVSAVNLEAHEASWLAALIDGEGTLGIYKQSRPENRSGWKYRGVVQICNTHLGLLQHVSGLLPGWLTVKDRRPGEPQYKILYSFMVSAKHIVDLLDAVSPFLIVKKKQAGILKQFCTLMADTTNRGCAANHEVYDRMWQEMKILNKRGR